ncbi:MAG: hypothetical protein KC415_22410 [Anaerolineales bacterium]|nr:hypothetical protein [Anaerolineales bacterium]
MGNNNPIFFLPVAKNLDRSKLSKWDDAVHFLPKDNLWHKQPEKYNVRICQSDHHWHPLSLWAICKGLQIGGLEFLEQEVACLDAKQLTITLNALEIVNETLVTSLPNLGEYEWEGSEWLRTTANHETFNQAVPCYDLVDNTYMNPAVSFFTFTKTLVQVIKDALDHGQWLVYFAPK